MSPTMPGYLSHRASHVTYLEPALCCHLPYCGVQVPPNAILQSTQHAITTSMPFRVLNEDPYSDCYYFQLDVLTPGSYHPHMTFLLLKW